jgi:enediyne biosynthesis protein E4
MMPAAAPDLPKPASGARSIEPVSPPWFQDVTERMGLNFVHEAGPTGKYFMPQLFGSGAALFDLDDDGRLDLYLLQNGGPDSGVVNRLFRQGADGRFIDVGKGSGLDIGGYNMGVAIGDVNNDGRLDVLVTQYGGMRLFLNQGNGTFQDVTSQSTLSSRLWGTSAAFLDYDRDGWLDLVVANYLNYDPSRWCADPDGRQDFCGPSAFLGTVAKLFRNLGGSQRVAANSVGFQEVTVEAGFALTPGPGLGVFCGDFSGDRWPDIMVANDGKPNHLWINQRDGTFQEEGLARGIAYNAMGAAEANMGIGIGDIDGDGLFDILVTHLTEETLTLWQQRPRGLFQDRTALAGLTRQAWRGTGFGVVLADFDQDGALDAAAVNGGVKRPQPAQRQPGSSSLPTSFWSAYEQRNQLFANDGKGRFRDISPANPPFCGATQVGRGLAFGDIDGDGALDLVVTSLAGPARVYRNVAPARGHWLMVRALDPVLRRDAYGAEITVRAGERRWVQYLNPGSSYLCSNDPRVHFGLGPVDRVDALEVVWPDGSEELFAGTAANRIVVVSKGKGKAANPSRPTDSEKTAAK